MLLSHNRWRWRAIMRPTEGEDTLLILPEASAYPCFYARRQRADFQWAHSPTDV